MIRIPDDLKEKYGVLRERLERGRAFHYEIEEYRLIQRIGTLTGEKDELHMQSPWWEDQAPGTTHWDGCYLDPAHRPCALQHIVDQERLIAFHVENLRIVHEAMGYPLRGDDSKTARDMALLAAERLRNAEEGAAVIFTAIRRAFPLADSDNPARMNELGAWHRWIHQQIDKVERSFAPKKSAPQSAGRDLETTTGV